MTTSRDPDEIMASWLDDGPTRLPDQTRRAIVVAVPTTTQRRGLPRPWRTPPMQQLPKLALGAIAVVAVVGVGWYLFAPGSTPPVGGPADPSPTPTASVAPSASPQAVGPAVIVTANASGCSLSGADGPIPVGSSASVVNDGPNSVYFEVAGFPGDHTYADFEAYIASEHDRAVAGEQLAGPPAFIVPAAARDVDAKGAGTLALPLEAGTYGIACIPSSDVGVPLDAFAVGPIEVVE